MAKFTALSLAIDNHTDCCGIMNAVQEYFTKKNDEFHYYAHKALEEDKPQEAIRLFKLRDDTYKCKYKTLDRLDKIRKKFESRMDYDE
jgi:hypothetical protein